MQSPQSRPKKLIDQIWDVIRTKHYSSRTEQIYVQWIYRYIICHNKCHPKDMGVPEIEAFLTDLIGAWRGLKIGLSAAPEPCKHTIKLLHKLNYAEPNDWSKPIPIGQPNEVVSVLIRKVRVG